ncbi:tetratricopeptide repeat-containing sensor histidine kinase [Flavihumibacter profundi]|uniref:tetratricopeptide repeat-containing sensor histidine kinase n=1 Tax=Flavihumibacter profundi TaxID=2716883 RepID=UPI001CC573FF|nr:ATP-binding protein [Flavihumibacter profundi]MBZ5858347.1 tetratricopeptide repeat protein [Flavihumibacter profundi]
MKIFRAFLVFTMFIASAVNAQKKGKPKDLLENSKPDTNRVNLLLELADQYYFNKPDSCLFLSKQAIELSRKLSYSKGELMALNKAGEALRFLGDFPQALEMQFKALQLNRISGDKMGEAVTMGFIGFVFIELNEYRQALNFLFQSKKIYEGISEPIMNTFTLSNIGNAYEGMNMLDSALFFQQLAQTKSLEFTHGNLKILILSRLGIVFARLGKYEQALRYYHEALQNAYNINDIVNPSKIQERIAETFLVINQKDSSLFYARLAFVNGQQVSQKLQILESSNLLVKLFRDKNMPDSIIHYQDIAIAMNDNLFGPEKIRQLQILTLKEQQRQQEILQEQERFKNRIGMFALLGMLAFLLIIAIILYRNNRHKQKVNLLLQDQKNEIQETLTILKSTQKQLVQKEKMASLGELTAGIAHEIENPLNFVNNFSEVNKELIEELQREIEKGNFNEVKNIALDIKGNEDKIIHHGKRADAIVKGMLQHSRTSTSEKELTAINVLADEHLRLAYHGLRANDKKFNTALHTEFDHSIGKINIVPQDIGRVLLNLYNNAFYSVYEKSRRNFPGFEPMVSVSTKKIGDKLEIRVIDNGMGIPGNVKEKIFQPFFTTKPTGQGTGLGLSLSYDIIKAHGGELTVETKEGEGACFIISLPVN